jgi:transposase
MIPIPSGVRVWIATWHTDMRRGMLSLALTVQESSKRDPHVGDLYIFRGRRGDLAKMPQRRCLMGVRHSRQRDDAPMVAVLSDIGADASEPLFGGGPSPD